LVGKPILDADVFSFNPAKLAQLLPECVHQDRHTGKRAWIQETYAKDFPRLLRLGGKAKSKEQSAKGKPKDAFANG
jgi:hypothetical protein